MNKSLFGQAAMALNVCLDEWSFVVMPSMNEVPAHEEYDNNPVYKNIIVDGCMFLTGGQKLPKNTRTRYE